MTHCVLCRQPLGEGDRVYCERCMDIKRTFYGAGLPRPGRLDLYEYWLDVPGLEGRYAVSTFGRVRNRSTGRFLTPSGRYPAVRLAGRTIRIHTLVATTFFGPRPPGQQVLHSNDDKQDNWVGNLKYGSPAQNAADAIRHGVRRRRCPTGRHRFTGSNVYIRSDGLRVCLDCLADAERRDPRAWRAWAVGTVDPPERDWDAARTGRAEAQRAAGDSTGAVGVGIVPRGRKIACEGTR